MESSPGDAHVDRGGGLLSMTWERQHPAGRGWGMETLSSKPRSCRQDGSALGSRACCLIGAGSASILLAVVGGWRRCLRSQGPAAKIHHLTIESSNYVVKAFTDAGPPVNGTLSLEGESLP